MPTYEYRCQACGHEFERFQKISDTPVRTCPSCKKRRVERLISSGGGFLFRGPGFYATDYRKDGPKAGSKSEEAGSGDKAGSEAEKKGGESDTPGKKKEAESS